MSTQTRDTVTRRTAARRLESPMMVFPALLDDTPKFSKLSTEAYHLPPAFIITSSAAVAGTPKHQTVSALLFLDGQDLASPSVMLIEGSMIF